MLNLPFILETIKVKKPVKFKIKKKYSKKFVAEHQAFTINGEVVEHVITINMGNIVIDSEHGERDIDTIIAHELIHAWQSERGHKDAHGKSFKRKVRQVAGKLGMPRLYLATVDQP